MKKQSGSSQSSSSSSSSQSYSPSTYVQKLADILPPNQRDEVVKITPVLSQYYEMLGASKHIPVYTPKKRKLEEQKTQSEPPPKTKKLSVRSAEAKKAELDNFVKKYYSATQ